MDIFKPGVNCLDVYEDIEVSIFRDSKSYFDELVEALKNARQTIYIAGWEMESQMWLQPDSPSPKTLESLLKELLSSRRDLQIYLLIWDMSEVKRMANNPIKMLRPGWFPHRRLKLRHDDHYPFGGCHHQKFVVIDDQLAYCGGIDLTVGRWDTPEHRPVDSRRSDAFGVEHGPIHDFQLRVDGEPAKKMGALFRERWLRVSRRPPRTPRVAPYPTPFKSTFRAKTLALARTDPAVKPSIREIERLFLDTIAAAKSYIFIENQYLTSPIIGDALSKRLEEADGPEIVIIGPREPAGWLEEITVGMLRWRVIERLRRADSSGRLRIVYPMASVENDVTLYVHSKFMIVDDAFIRVGSANISQRSFRIDSELDIAAISEDHETLRRLLCELLAEHTTLPVDRVQDALRDSIVKGLDALMLEGESSDRRLVTLGNAPQAAWRKFAHDGDILFDPDRPRSLAQIADVVLGAKARKRFLKRVPNGLISTIVWTALCLISAKVLHLSSVDVLQIDAFFASWQALVAITLGCLVLLSFGAPIFVVLVFLNLVFDGITSIPAAFLVTTGAAVVSYRLGQRVGRSVLNRIWGLKVKDVQKELFRRGVFSIVALRFLPISTFAAVGLAAGAASHPFKPYVIGSVLGMVPNVLLLSLTAMFIARYARYPNPFELALVATSLAFIALVMKAVSRHMQRKN